MQWWMQRCSTSYTYRHDQQSYAEVLRHLPRPIAPATVTLECAVVSWDVPELSSGSLARDGSYAYGVVLVVCCEVVQGVDMAPCWQRTVTEANYGTVYFISYTRHVDEKYTRNYDTPNRSVLMETFEYVTSLCMWWILNGWTYELFVFVQHYNMVELSNMVHSIFIFHWWINNQISNMYIIGNQISYTP